MAIDEAQLLTGEAVSFSKSVNLIIQVADAGLTRFAADHAMARVGLKDQEGIGGRLHLTNYRLIFKAHAANRMHGSVSVFLPTIREVKNTSSGLKRQVDIVTGGQHFTFVVWGIPKLIAAIEAASGALTPADTARIADLAVAAPQLVSDGLVISTGIEAVNTALTRLTHRSAAAAIAKTIGPESNSIQRAGAANLTELLELAPDAG